MGSVQQLVTDFTALGVESKRRFPDIKQGCDSAINQLKSLNQTTSINDIHLQDNGVVIVPFISACKSGNAKLITLSIPIIHRLIMATIIPPGHLNDLVDSLQEASNLAIDIQLRILQCLPTLMQNYHSFFTGPLLVKLLTVCSNLTANNKSTVVINTASATLQQLFSNIFDINVDIDKAESDNVHEVIIDHEETIKVNHECFECYNIFQDLCRLLENEPPTYFTNSIHIKVLSVLEIVETIIVNHKQLFQTHQELAYLLRIKIIPSLLRILNSSHQRNFPYITRTMRVLHVLLASQLDNLEIECEIVLSFLNHILLNNENEADLWEKILVLETYKGLFSDFQFIKSIFEKYDNNPRKKNVLQELTAILNTFLSSNSYLFNDIVKRPSVVPLQPPSSAGASSSSIPAPQSPSKGQDQSTPVYLSKTSSHLKTPLIDHFDKSEPPAQLPKTYPIYLIYNILLSYADGIAGFVQSLSNDSDPLNLEADVEFTNAFIESNYNDISILFERFIYSAMDDESFHLLIRSFQRFTHSTGLLGLTSIRDGLLIILSNSITHNVSKDESKTLATSGSSLQLQGKQLLAFGESLVETFSSSLSSQKQAAQNPPESHQSSLPVTVRSRYMNTRHVTCLRALANLAVSLGSTLQTSWTIIWITFQWCDYFINGPDEYSGFFNHKAYKSFNESMLPHLSPQDINNIDSSKKKLMDSFKEYPVESYNELINAVLELSNQVFNEQYNHQVDTSKITEDDEDDEKEVEYDEKKPFHPPPPNASNGHSSVHELVQKPPLIETCPYNKTYFIDRLLELCQTESNKFLVLSNESWDSITEYFIKLGNRRDIPYNLRLYIVQSYNQIIKNLSDEGFGIENEEINHQTSIKSLDGLNRYLIGLFNLGVPQELLVLNCETEIHLSTLTILHGLIDQYDSYYKNSWNTVFTILDTPFKVTQDTSINKEEVNLRERIRLLIEKSFDTLKLILDEFLSSIPSNQLILLIDTLYNFCSQTFDLNISFSSISYFWLISDSLKSRILKFDKTNTKFLDEELINDDLELITKINQTQNDKDEYLYHTLIIIYLLSKLVKLSLDKRAQVRDGSIQTFFQIIEVHGDLITESKSWDLIYTIVLPTLFNIELNLNDSKFNRKEWIESLHLILTGFILIYNKFMIKFEQIPNIINKWVTLIKYFKNLLTFKWVDLNLKVFKSFQDLLVPFQGQGEPVKFKPEFRDLLFKFWCDIPVEYDFINPLYQESITSFMNCFKPLYSIIKSGVVTNEEINTILNLLNKCARYPILPDNQGDNIKPSKLQRAVLDNLKIIQLNDSNIRSHIIQQLSNIIVYPFGTRLRIEQKLTNNKLINGNKFKLPTFIAISHLSLELLKERLDELNGDDFAVLLQDKGINKILKSLLEVIKTRSVGIVSKEKNQIWIESNEIVKNIIRQLIESGQIIDEELWKLIVESIKLCLMRGEAKEDGEERENDKKSLQPRTNEDEVINVKQYHELIDIILPRLIETGDGNILQDLIETIYENSFLYEFDESESLMIEVSNKDNYVLIDNIINFNFSETFGSTKAIRKFDNKFTRFNCLTELIKFCLAPQESVLNSTSENYFIMRSIFCIRRFISDQKLLYKCPISKVQQEELLIILRGVINIQQQEERGGHTQKFKQLNRLLIKLIPFSDRIHGLEQLLEIVLQKL